MRKLISGTRVANVGQSLASTLPWIQITACGNWFPFMEGGEVLGLGGQEGGGEESEGADALTASAKLLREEEVSLLRSSSFSFTAAITGVISTVGAGGEGVRGGVSLCALLDLSPDTMEQSEDVVFKA